MLALRDDDTLLGKCMLFKFSISSNYFYLDILNRFQVKSKRFHMCLNFVMPFRRLKFIPFILVIYTILKIRHFLIDINTTIELKFIFYLTMSAFTVTNGSIKKACFTML